MSIIDFIIILVFIGAVVYGWMRGMIVQFGSLAGVLLGILLCRLFGQGFSNFLISIFSSEPAPSEDTIYICGVVANVILFLIGFVAAKIAARFVKTVSKAVKLTLVDKMCGVVFALFEWFMVLSILMNVWQIFRPSSHILSESSLGGGRSAHAIMNLAPNVLGNETAQAIFDVGK